MKIGIYNPYFDTLGGGERYILHLASHLSNSHQVDVFWDDESILKMAEDRFKLNLSRVKIVQNIFTSDFFPVKLLKTVRYDLIIFFTDGSIPTTFAKKNILLFEIPFQRMKFPLWKQKQFSRIVCISNFTKKNLPLHISQKSDVIYPPVDVDEFESKKKEKIILTVGRFGTYPSKKYNILIEAFSQFHKKNNDYTLIIAGGLHQSDIPYFNKLRQLARGTPVEFHPNITFEKLKSLYSKSLVYWHAAGFGETNPENMEHFGITPVEAMASGAIPCVYRGGGLTEIVEDGVSGLVWDTKDELVSKTIDVIANRSLRSMLKDNAIAKSRDFHPNNFYASFDQLVNSLG